MKDNNIITLIGNVGNEPEMRILKNGTKLSTFSLAVTDNYKDKDGQWQKKTEWHDCVAWAKVADLVERRVNKGSFLLIKGQLVYNRWEDKNGSKRKDARIKVENILFLERPIKKDDSSGYGDSVPAGTAIPETTDEMPF